MPGNGSRLISPEVALGIVLSNVRPLAPRRVAIDRAFNCRLAEDVRSDRDQPPTDRSSMDGYAVIAADLRPVPARLRWIGEVAAGSTARLRVRRGTCAAMLTGASLPPGADAVVPVEHTDRDGDAVVVRTAFRRRRLRAKAGRRGGPRPSAPGQGSRLGPAEIGVCAMVGKKEPRVHPRPRVAVLCTGAEVREAGAQVGPEQIRDSNGPSLAAALAEQGIADIRCMIVPDDPDRIASHLRRAADTAGCGAHHRRGFRRAVRFRGRGGPAGRRADPFPRRKHAAGQAAALCHAGREPARVRPAGEPGERADRILRVRAARFAASRRRPRGRVPPRDEAAPGGAGLIGRRPREIRPGPARSDGRRPGRREQSGRQAPPTSLRPPARMA